MAFWAFDTGGGGGGAHPDLGTHDALGLATDAEVTAHKASADHDGRYFTEAEADARFAGIALVDAKGDLIVATGPDALARLGVGAEGQVLVSRAASIAGVTWEAPGAAAHPDLATHDALGLATDAEIAAHAAAADPHAGYAPVTHIFKTANQDIASSIVYTPDTELVLPVGANEIWAVDFMIFYEAATASDFKIQMRGPAGCSLMFGVYGFDVTDTNNPGLMGVDVLKEASGESHLAGFGAGSTLWCEPTGIIVNGATPGNLTLEWAQRVSGATATRVLANSYIQALQVA